MPAKIDLMSLERALRNTTIFRSSLASTSRKWKAAPAS